VNPKSGQFKDLAAQLRSAAEDLARARGWTCGQARSSS
jgi:hypothetical protein